MHKRKNPKPSSTYLTWAEARPRRHCPYCELWRSPFHLSGTLYPLSCIRDLRAHAHRQIHARFTPMGRRMCQKITNRAPSLSFHFTHAHNSYSIFQGYDDSKSANKCGLPSWRTCVHTHSHTIMQTQRHTYWHDEHGVRALASTQTDGKSSNTWDLVSQE